MEILVATALSKGEEGNLSIATCLMELASLFRGETEAAVAGSVLLNQCSPVEHLSSVSQRG